MKWIKVAEQRPNMEENIYVDCLLKTSDGYVFYGTPSDIDGKNEFMYGAMLLPLSNKVYLSFSNITEWLDLSFGWIKCSEKLPNVSKCDEHYQCFIATSFSVEFGYYQNDFGHRFYSTKNGKENLIEIPTHWHPMLENPNEEV